MALITGGGTGLGAALADRLAARGHDLLLVTRDPERVAPTARELAARYGIRADVLLADLGTRHGLFRLEAFLAGPEAPAVDVLVHDALADAAGAAPDAGRASVDLGMTATMRLTHAALPGMLRRGTGGIVAIGGDERSATWAVSFATSLAPTLTGDVHVVAVRGDDRPEWTADAADTVLEDLDAGLVVSAPQSGPARPGPARRAVAAGVRAARRGVELFADATWEPTGAAAVATPAAAIPAAPSATPEELLGGAGHREPSRLPDLPSRPGAGRAVVAAGDCGRHWAAGPVRTAAQRARASAAARDRSRGHQVSAYMTSTVTSS
ncbi:MAG: SDR family NAD(P)-dependent oxidoreductase [Actinomycetota bacterium]